jgi:hypothetical protein
MDLVCVRVNPQTKGLRRGLMRAAVMQVRIMRMPKAQPRDVRPAFCGIFSPSALLYCARDARLGSHQGGLLIPDQ